MCVCVCVCVYLCVCVCVCIGKDSLRKKHYRSTHKKKKKTLKESYDLLRKSTLNGHKVKASSIITSKSCHSALYRHLCKNENRI